LGRVCREYSSNTIDNEWFNILYSGMDGRIFPTDPSIPENMLNRSLLIVLEEYSLQTHPSQNIC
jgi:hypothetical protein